jgi:hypothetical protein
MNLHGDAQVPICWKAMSTFVIRFTTEAGFNAFKTFGRKSDAEIRFWAGWNEMAKQAGSSGGLYEVPDSESFVDAIEAVKTKRPGVMVLLSRPG